MHKPIIVAKPPQWNVKGNSCIHSFIDRLECGRVAFNRRTNGWLCKDHYAQLQAGIQPKPRHEQPKWKGLTPQFQTDAEVIADIIATDALYIATGNVVRIQRGAQDPVVLRVLEQRVH